MDRAEGFDDAEDESRGQGRRGRWIARIGSTTQKMDRADWVDAEDGSPGRGRRGSTITRMVVNIASLVVRNNEPSVMVCRIRPSSKGNGDNGIDEFETGLIEQN